MAGLAARTHASIEAAGNAQTRANFEEMARLANQAIATSDDALAAFARGAGKIVLFGLAAVVGLLVWRFARR
jgi:hypothetical protein